MLPAAVSSVSLRQAGFALKSIMVSTSAATVFGLASWMLFQGPAGPALSFLVRRRAWPHASGCASHVLCGIPTDSMRHA